MIPRQPDRPAEPNLALSQTRERRAFIRYARRIDILWQLLGMSPRDLTQAELFDVSANGVGLVCDRPLPVDARLILRLPTATAGWSSHLVRVKRCIQRDDGAFEVGCGFTRPLTASHLQALLE
jgi:hypothetical protein